MGCLLGKANRISDCDASTTGPVIENFVSSRQLLTFFDEQSNMQHTSKCIFVLGSSGSGKGEFIWNLMKDHQSCHQSDYKLFYLDIENLICDNIKNRVKELLRENRYAGHSSSASEVWSENENDISQSEQQQQQQAFNLTTANSRSDLSLIDAINQSDQAANENETDMATLSRVKGYLNEFANFITGYWIQTLIADEIVSKTDESIDHNVFLINLIPNRISHFKRCLYLNQTPNFYHTPFDFYAINLINEEYTKKDLDILDGVSFQNEVNSMFVKYFRSINKLTHVKTNPLISIKSQELRIKLVSSSSSGNNEQHTSAIPVNNKEQLSDMVKNHDRSQILQLNIDQFTPLLSGENNAKYYKKGKCNLFFVINNRIELEDVIIDVDQCKINPNLRYFVKELKDVCRDLIVPLTNVATTTTSPAPAPTIVVTETTATATATTTLTETTSPTPVTTVDTIG